MKIQKLESMQCTHKTDASNLEDYIDLPKRCRKRITKSPFQKRPRSEMVTVRYNGAVLRSTNAQIIQDFIDDLLSKGFIF